MPIRRPEPAHHARPEVADVNAPESKTEIHSFWNAASCGEVYAEGDDAAQRYDRHSGAQYRLEPYP
jgi:hypothetical protein